MSLVIEREAPPLREDETGAIRVGNSRVLLEIVIRAFQDGASPESIVQRYSTLSLSDVYSTIGYYLRHQDAIAEYLNQREQAADFIAKHLREKPPASPKTSDANALPSISGKTDRPLNATNRAIAIRFRSLE